MPSAERVFPHRLPVQQQQQQPPPCAARLQNGIAGTICSVLTAPPVLASSAKHREEAAGIRIPAERKEKMLGWDTEGKLSEERNKDCKSQRLLKRKRGNAGSRTRFISSNE